jgi:hypothetical protein
MVNACLRLSLRPCGLHPLMHVKEGPRMDHAPFSIKSVMQEKSTFGQVAAEKKGGRLGSEFEWVQ